MAFDIETIGNPDVIDKFPEPEADPRLKDPVKIAADLEKKRKKQISRMALNGNTCRVVGCGFAYYAPVDDGLEIDSHGISLQGVEGERAFIGRLWDTLLRHGAPFVTFNGKGFDVPILLRRSAILGLIPPHTIETAKYKEPPTSNHWDMQGVYGHYGSMETGGLDFLASMVLGEGKYDDGSERSENVGELFAAEKYAEIEKRAAKDAELTLRLWAAARGVYFAY